MVKTKKFDEWIELEEKLHDINHLRAIHEGEVWWCAMGENIGIEINGKNEVFSRPVLIFKKTQSVWLHGDSVDFPRTRGELVHTICVSG